uniref:Prothymosin alpha n=1 Tax=Moschus moschiferus TaxID=68415 RepID=A0A8C6DDD2_MOSMO
CGFSALGFEKLRVWRSSAPARRVGLAACPGECLRPRRENGTLRRNRFFFLSFGTYSCPCGDRRESPWRLLNPCAPGVTPGSFPGATSREERGLGHGSPPGLPPALSEPSQGTSLKERDLKEKKEVVEEAENGREAPANGNANEENGEQEADNEVDEEEEEGGEEEEEEEEGDGEEEDGDEDEEAEAATGKRAAEDDEDDDVDTKKQKTDEDD